MWQPGEDTEVRGEGQVWWGCCRVWHQLTSSSSRLLPHVCHKVKGCLQGGGERMCSLQCSEGGEGQRGGQRREEGPRREERYRGEEGKHGNAMCVCMRTYSFPARSKRHSVERVLA